MEGYTDVILAHQAGFENTVSTSGTALTTSQLAILKRYSDNLYLAFDMDIAGDSATKRGIDLAQLSGFNLKIVTLPEDKDPADIISKDPKEFEKLINNSLSILDFYFQNAFSQFDKAKPEGKREISKILLTIIKRVPNKIEQSFWISKLAKNLEVKEEKVEEELKKIEPAPYRTEGSGTRLEDEALGLEPEEIINRANTKSRKELLEERLMTLILKSPQCLSQIDKKFISLFSPATQEILNNFQNQKNLSQENSDSLNYLYLKSEVEEIEEKEIVPEIQFCQKISGGKKGGGIGVLKFEVSDGCFKKSLDSRPVHGIAKEIYLLGRNIF